MQHFITTQSEPILCIHRVRTVLFMEDNHTISCLNKEHYKALIGWLKDYHIPHIGIEGIYNKISLPINGEYWLKATLWDCEKNVFYIMKGKETFRFTDDNENPEE